MTGSMLIQFSPSFVDFNTLLIIWKNSGLFNIVLPFLLIFALVFAILEKSKVLGRNRGVYAVIAVVISFFAVSDPTLSSFFAVLFAHASLGFAILLVFVLFLGLFIVKEGKGWWVWIGGLFGILIFFWVLSNSIQQSGLQYTLYSFFSANPYLWSTIVYGGAILAVIILIILLVPQGDEPPYQTLKRIFSS